MQTAELLVYNSRITVAKVEAEIRRPFLNDAAHWIAELHQDRPWLVLDVGAGVGLASTTLPRCFPRPRSRFAAPGAFGMQRGPA